MSGRLRAYVAFVVLAAAALLATHVPSSVGLDWGHYVAWMLIAILSDTMWSATMHGQATWSLSSTAGLATVVLWGPGPAMWIAALSTLLADLFVLRKPWVRAVFNASQITLTTWIAAACFIVLGGPAAGIQSTPEITLGTDAVTRIGPGIVAMMLAYFLVNRALVTVAVAWSSDRPYLRALREDWFYSQRLFSDVSAFLLSPLMVISYHAIGYAGVVLFYAPLFMIHESDRRFVELKRAEEQNLRNARFAAKGELAAGIGHELNNQLVAITARAQMLLKDAERQRFENAPKHAQIILEQSRRMGVLAKGLMDYTRNQVNVEPMDLNTLLQSTIEFVKGEPRFRGVEWIVELDPALPELQGDLGQIQGVFINLFVNAADAMSTQETRRAISVRTARDERLRAARVIVGDTGPGIRSEDLPHMFEFMFTTKPDGHGFGLSTSHRTIENHGGRITVESPAGSGARFTIVLPIGGPGGWR